MIRIKEENDENVSRQKREEQKNSTTKLSLRKRKFENEKEQTPTLKIKLSFFNMKHSNIIKEAIEDNLPEIKN